MLAERLLDPVREAGVDALLLGCTHYPFLARTIGDVMGRDVVLVSSADETAFALKTLLGDRELESDITARRQAPLACRRGDAAAFARPRPPPPRPRAGRRRRAGVDVASRRMSSPRHDGRHPNQLRPVTFDPRLHRVRGRIGARVVRAHRVLCTASANEDVPRWMKGKGKGWVTAEYSMLPGSTPDRNDREAAKGKQKGRTLEIQRLIGRALRAVTDTEAHGRGRDHARLRRAAGRRRHAHRVDLRRLRRAARRAARASSPPASMPEAPAHRRLRRGLGRHGRTARPCSTSTTTRTTRPKST